MSSILHIIKSELIRPKQLERPDADLNQFADVEILVFKVIFCFRVNQFIALQKLSFPNAGISLRIFVNHHGIIAAEERNQKLSNVVVFALAYESCFISKYILILGVHLRNILLRSFWLKIIDATQRIFWSTITIVGWYWMNEFLGSILFDCDGYHF